MSSPQTTPQHPPHSRLTQTYDTLRLPQNASRQSNASEQPPAQADQSMAALAERVAKQGTTVRQLTPRRSITKNPVPAAVVPAVVPQDRVATPDYSDDEGALIATKAPATPTQQQQPPPQRIPTPDYSDEEGSLVVTKPQSAPVQQQQQQQPPQRIPTPDYSDEEGSLVMNKKPIAVSSSRIPTPDYSDDDGVIATPSKQPSSIASSGAVSVSTVSSPSSFPLSSPSQSALNPFSNQIAQQGRSVRQIAPRVSSGGNAFARSAAAAAAATPPSSQTSSSPSLSSVTPSTPSTSANTGPFGRIPTPDYSDEESSLVVNTKPAVAATPSARIPTPDYSDEESSLVVNTKPAVTTTTTHARIPTPDYSDEESSLVVNKPPSVNNNNATTNTTNNNNNNSHNNNALASSSSSSLSSSTSPSVHHPYSTPNQLLSRAQQSAQDAMYRSALVTKQAENLLSELIAANERASNFAQVAQRQNQLIKTLLDRVQQYPDFSQAYSQAAEKHRALLLHDNGGHKHGHIGHDDDSFDDNELLSQFGTPTKQKTADFEAGVDIKSLGADFNHTDVHNIGASPRINRVAGQQSPQQSSTTGENTVQPRRAVVNRFRTTDDSNSGSSTSGAAAALVALAAASKSAKSAAAASSSSSSSSPVTSTPISVSVPDLTPPASPQTFISPFAPQPHPPTPVASQYRPDYDAPQYPYQLFGINTHNNSNIDPPSPPARPKNHVYDPSIDQAFSQMVHVSQRFTPMTVLEPVIDSEQEDNSAPDYDYTNCHQPASTGAAFVKNFCQTGEDDDEDDEDEEDDDKETVPSRRVRFEPVGSSLAHIRVERLEFEPQQYENLMLIRDHFPDIDGIIENTDNTQELSSSDEDEREEDDNDAYPDLKPGDIDPLALHNTELNSSEPRITLDIANKSWEITPHRRGQIHESLFQMPGYSSDDDDDDDVNHRVDRWFPTL